MNNHLVSVGVPVLNGEKWISRALDSLLTQNYDNLEILISDNASSDDTFKICSEYASNNKNISVVHKERTVDIVDNFKAVLHSAQGKYFMWAAVDDCWHPEFISELVKKLEADEKCAVAQSGALLYSDENLNKIIQCVRFNGKANIEKLSMLNVTKRILSPPKYNYYIYGLFRRKILAEAFEFMPGVPSSDRLFLLQFPLSGYKMAYVDAPLYMRTITEVPVYERYKKDAYCEQVRIYSKKWFEYSGYGAIKKMFSESSLLSGCNGYIKNFVLLQYLYWKTTFGFCLMANSLLYKTLSFFGEGWFLELMKKRKKAYLDCWKK